ncbi:MAG: hypothetical protein COA78_06900 [Blastopirellula sp.]|nr:MAG: hypothetical protein COA78_06900 [Blastopirellula sp.]
MTSQPPPGEFILITPQMRDDVLAAKFAGISRTAYKESIETSCREVLGPLVSKEKLAQHIKTATTAVNMIWNETH